MTTQVEIADTARIIRTGYPEAAEAYRRDCEVLATIRSTPGMAEHEADAMHNANCRSKTCAEYTQRLGALANLVTKHLPDLWRDLHLVGSGDRWHEDQAFDWPAAEKELRTIEAAAVGKDGADREDKKAVDAPALTPPMTRVCIAEIFNCHRNQVKTNVLDEHDHELSGRKIRMRVADMPRGWEAVAQRHAHKSR